MERIFLRCIFMKFFEILEVFQERRCFQDIWQLNLSIRGLLLLTCFCFSLTFKKGRCRWRPKRPVTASGGMRPQLYFLNRKQFFV